MKIYTYKIRKHTLHLLYNAEAMLQVQDLDVNVSNLGKDTSRESFEMLVKIICIMAEQGELYRRYMGYDSESIITEKELRAIAMPKDWVNLRVGMMQAVIEGMNQESTEEDEEIDLGLLELNKNKKKESKSAK